MKLSLLSLLSSISLICYLTTTPQVKANSITNQPQSQITAQEIALKKLIISTLGSIGRAQQSYFLENTYFANQIQKLGLDNNIENTIQGYQWQVLTDKKAKKIVMTVLLPKQSGAKTYVNFVSLTTADNGDPITISTLCESEQNQRLVPQLPTKILKNQGVECPTGFRKLEFSENENSISEQVSNEENLKILVGFLNHLQQQYYSQNRMFTDKMEQLFGGYISQIDPTLDLKLKFLPIQNTKKGIINIVALPNQNYKSYLGIITANVDKTNQISGIICEVPPQISVDIDNLQNSSPNKLTDCPQSLIKINLSAEEIAHIKEGLSTINQYQSQIAEINQPQKTPLLRDAEQLTQEGKYLQALQKYYLALGSLGINEYDIFVEMSGESSFNPLRDAFFKKIKPVLEAAKPLLAKQRQEIKSEMLNVFNQFPTEKNNTAKKIQEVAALQLGFNVLTNPQQDLKIPENQNKAFSEISELLKNSFDEKTQQLNSNLPINLRRYINKNKNAIAAIRNVLLNNEIPHWGLDYTYVKEGDFHAPSPSYLGIINLQRLLIVDIADNLQQGKTQEMLKSLEASWKLSESLKDEPTLIGQLVNVIIRRSQIRIIEKIEHLPIVWQQRLLAHDYTKSMFLGLNIEAFAQLQGLNKIIPPEKDTPLSQLYRDWYGVNTYQLYQKFYGEIARNQHHLCSLDLRAIEQQYFSSENSISPSYVNQIIKSQHLMLESEMMQKVLQIKATIQQKKVLPNTLADIPSNICIGNKWVYKSLANGKWWITLDRPPIWQSQIE